MAASGLGSIGESRMSSAEREGSGSGTGPDAPLYERLPRGPHRLNHKQVIRNQRNRLHGAMVEAVATNGYDGASIRQVVELAGVSRRSFYELFANKQECFLATFDLIAARAIKRTRRAYRASQGDLEDRMRAALGQLARGIDAHWKEARLVVVEAQTAGPAALSRLRRTTATYEMMLYSSFARAPGSSPVPLPVLRGVVGGLQGVISTCLREESAGQLSALVERMLSWTLLFRTPAAGRLAGVEERLRERSGEDHRTDLTDMSGGDDRERLLHHALRLALVEDYKQLSAPKIAEEANVPIDVFFELFDCKDECFLAGLDTVGEELLGVAAAPAQSEGDWPRMTRRVLGELMVHLAERPLHAQTIAAGAFAAGLEAAERNREFGHRLVALLLRGAPEEKRSSFITEALYGAIGHTIRCQVASEQIQLLPALSDHLAYVVLAPFIGAGPAAGIVSEEQPEAAPQGG
jgi:AcrR family transcriptional regulator